MVQGNRSIRDHKREGRALHVFDAEKGMARHLGEFQYVRHYDADAPPRGGRGKRKVIVFVLRRLTGTTPLPKAEVAREGSGSWVKEVPVEQHTTTDEFEVNPNSYKAKRREQKLVKAYEDWCSRLDARFAASSSMPKARRIQFAATSLTRPKT